VVDNLIAETISITDEYCRRKTCFLVLEDVAMPTNRSEIS
jgi:hypothetical protein